MRPPSSLKEEFLKKWQMGLEIFHSSVENTSVVERRKAIKLTADIAMASLRKGTTCWSRALIAKTANSKDKLNNLLVRRILSSIQADKLINKKLPKTVCHKKIVKRSKKFLKRRSSSSSSPSSRDDVIRKMAKSLVERKTQGLRSLVPGGEFMRNEFLLIRETLDYVTLLQMEVDVMRRLADAAEAEMVGK
ncbi:PREDICTED: uncharacterized protein LOC104819987 [Tarenaya hassleriana]|uniref:uncharacterized protein LOC104819987 n=1 Tax=Tarenaya hassleriana TaxID=28532 RepID=UPI00053C2C15|nr:PREDICTED: uncharacterized protein LOC104819987 [Tarenaya hassleriana]